MFWQGTTNPEHEEYAVERASKKTQATSELVNNAFSAHKVNASPQVYYTS